MTFLFKIKIWLAGQQYSHTSRKWDLGTCSACSFLYLAFHSSIRVMLAAIVLAVYFAVMIFSFWKAPACIKRYLDKLIFPEYDITKRTLKGRVKLFSSINFSTILLLRFLRCSNYQKLINHLLLKPVSDREQQPDCFFTGKLLTPNSSPEVYEKQKYCAKSLLKGMTSGILSDERSDCLANAVDMLFGWLLNEKRSVKTEKTMEWINKANSYAIQCLCDDPFHNNLEAPSQIWPKLWFWFSLMWWPNEYS